ncbi:MAG: T6SS immunity protein Tdi1 domain-containing protein [Paracoccaceae bacterium]
MVDVVRAAWGWCGIIPAKIIAINDFGNLIVEDRDQAIWRICPEELSCVVVARDRGASEHLFQNAEFVADWKMAALVERALAALGPLSEGKVYYFVTSAVFGGAYHEDNMRIIDLQELIGVAGSIAHQIDGLPDGTQVQLVVTD